MFYCPNHVPKIVEAKNVNFLEDYEFSECFYHKNEFEKNKGSN